MHHVTHLGQPYKLFALDVDGTIADQNSTTLYPWVVAWLQTLPADARIALATNQGGPACHDAGWSWSDQYPTLEQVNTRLRELADTIMEIAGRPLHLLVCYLYVTKADQEYIPKAFQPDDEFPGYQTPVFCTREWRKPATGMLIEAMRQAQAEPAQTVVIGDRWEDYAMAMAVPGVDFYWASVNTRIDAIAKLPADVTESVADSMADRPVFGWADPR